MIKIGKDIFNWYTCTCQPKTREELLCIINERISRFGPKCDLNDIDTSLITDMSWLFYKSQFNGNIYDWDVSKVENMESMFAYSSFNHDISRWNARNVKDMFFHVCLFKVQPTNWKLECEQS